MGPLRIARLQRESIADLVTELQNALTPVLAYAELMSDESLDVSADQMFRWAAAIERGLDRARPINDEIGATCSSFRDRVRDRS